METLLSLIVVWSIVAAALYCCYRLWYWVPTPAAIPTVEARPEPQPAVDRSRAA